MASTTLAHEHGGGPGKVVGGHSSSQIQRIVTTPLPGHIRDNAQITREKSPGIESEPASGTLPGTSKRDSSGSSVWVHQPLADGVAGQAGHVVDAQSFHQL